MERVQWNQEQMIAELKDLQEKQIFSAAEVREIFKKRSVFETALVRRTPQKRDFLAYAEYEMNLEQLRRLRVKKMSEFLPVARRWLPVLMNCTVWQKLKSNIPCRTTRLCSASLPFSSEPLASSRATFDYGSSTLTSQSGNMRLSLQEEYVHSASPAMLL